MRRLVAAALTLAVALVVVVALPRSSAESASSYRVDAIFDTAKGIIPGQLAKIAGAKVGKVEDVTLTPGFKARIEMSVDQEFAPFRTDARCEIRPEGLIAENFVNCDPGSQDAPQLEGKDDHAPTVPLARTAVPVNLTDLFRIFNAPTRERFPLVVSTLGLGLAGRGEDLNAILLRANPTLQDARRALRILSDQRAELQTIVDASDRVVGELAGRRGQLQDFIEQGARVTTRTANRRGPLAEAVRRLPALLDATEPALRRLDQLVADGTPVLNDLRTAAPDVNRLVAELEPFSNKALRVLRRTGRVADEGSKAARSARPVLADLERFAKEGIPTADLLNTLFVSLRDRGFVEGLLNFTYSLGAGAARYDSVSHILPARLSANECTVFSPKPVAGCSAKFGDDGAATAGASVASARSEAFATSQSPRGIPARPPASPRVQSLQALLDLLLK